MTSRTQLALAGALVALVLAGCSTGATAPGGASAAPTGSASAPASPAAGPGTPAVGQHGAADIQFATMMIPHHTQAVAMSDTLLSKQGVDAKVTALATRIKAEQAPEIIQMSGWLAGWGRTPARPRWGAWAGWAPVTA